MYKTLAGEIIADEVADQQVRAANALLVHAGPLIKADLPLRCGYTRCGRILRGHQLLHVSSVGGARVDTHCCACPSRVDQGRSGLVE